MDRQQEAKKLIPQLLAIVSSDLQKVEHYMKKAVEVAVVAKDKNAQLKIASIYIEVQELNNHFELLTAHTREDTNNE